MAQARPAASTLPWNRGLRRRVSESDDKKAMSSAGEKDYIGRMDTRAKGPVATEIESRLRLAFNPTHLLVINDSEKHRGHAGHDGSGESHFTVELVSTAFMDQGRLARQRMVNDALRELLVEKIHALSIRALAPHEQPAGQ